MTRIIALRMDAQERYETISYHRVVMRTVVRGGKETRLQEYEKNEKILIRNEVFHLGDWSVYRVRTLNLRE